MNEVYLLHHAQCMASGHYGGFVDGMSSVCVEGHQRMPALMVRCPLERLCCPHHRPVDIRRTASFIEKMRGNG